MSADRYSRRDMLRMCGQMSLMVGGSMVSVRALSGCGDDESDDGDGESTSGEDSQMTSGDGPNYLGIGGVGPGSSPSYAPAE